MRLRLPIVRATLSSVIGRRFDADALEPRFWHLVVLLVLQVALLSALHYAVAGPDGWFQPTGVNWLVADYGGALIVMGVFASKRHLTGEMVVGMSAALAIGLMWTVVGSFVAIGYALLPLGSVRMVLGPKFVSNIVAGAWTCLALLAVYRSFEWGSGCRMFARAGMASLVLWGASELLEPDPVFANRQILDRVAQQGSFWTDVQGWLSDGGVDTTSADDEGDPTEWFRAEWDEARKLDEALSKLEARETARSNVFVLGIAGMEQAVFERESRAALRILDGRFSTGTRSLRLTNSADDSPDVLPATLTGLGRIIRGIAARMDLQQDALLIFMTSHGSEAGVALDGPHAYSTIRPADLRHALDDAGIRNRIIIVSACHSGVFLPALADANSVVIAAAASDRVSFGCNDKNEWTYFGRALFEEGLRDEKTLTAAFGRARDLVRSWEPANQPHSEPQIHVGAAIAALLPNIVGDPAEVAETSERPKVLASVSKDAEVGSERPR